MSRDRDIINDQLKRILQDKNFSRSKIYGRLLKYLVQATLEGKDIKELTIGIELFGKSYDPIKSDNKVRVYVYHLRKKLDAYYEQSTIKNELVFEIQKGQYNVQFIDAQPVGKTKQTKHLKIWGTIAMVCILIVTLISRDHIKNPFWSVEVDGDYPINVIFGDYYTFEGPLATGEYGISRDYSINSSEDFQDFLNEHPNQANEYRPSPHPYLGWFAPYCSYELSQFFIQEDLSFNIGMMSEWSRANLNTEHIVYIGQSKLMGILGQVLIETFPNYRFGPQYLVREDPFTLQSETFIDEVDVEEKLIDYTIVAKVTKPSGNTISYFLSDQDFGVISAVEYFTNIDSTENFYHRHQLNDQDFIALFRTSGWKRKIYDMELMYVDEKQGNSQNTNTP